MLASLREHDLLKVEAFVAWLGEHDIHIDRTLVSHWTAGRSHLPADLLPLLAEYTERPDLVFGEFLRDLGQDVVNIPVGVPKGKDLTDVMMGLNISLGRLQAALMEAREPTSPGGEAVVEEERVLLRKLLNDLMHQAAELRAELKLRHRS